MFASQDLTFSVHRKEKDQSEAIKSLPAFPAAFPNSQSPLQPSTNLCRLCLALFHYCSDGGVYVSDGIIAFIFY